MAIFVYESVNRQYIVYIISVNGKTINEHLGGNMYFSYFRAYLRLQKTMG